MGDTPSESSTHPSLLLRLRNTTDAEAWQTFVQVYAPVIYGYTRKRGVQDADAADITQDVLTRVSRALRTFEYQPLRGRFRDWLGTVTRHQLLRFLDRQQRQQQVVGDGRAADLEQAIAPEADAEWTAAFHAQLLRAALERIRPHFEADTWRIFERVWQENRPALETAQEVGVTIDKVYAAKMRVLKRLREEILELAEDLPQCVPL
jgi:RNA polymerase sigma-70 factor (ECF subfamily)